MGTRPCASVAIVGCVRFRPLSSFFEGVCFASGATAIMVSGKECRGLAPADGFCFGWNMGANPLAIPSWVGGRSPRPACNGAEDVRSPWYHAHARFRVRPFASVLDFGCIACGAGGRVGTRHCRARARRSSVIVTACSVTPHDCYPHTPSRSRNSRLPSTPACGFPRRAANVCLDRGVQGR